jgi:hypothetical protein
VNSFQQGEQRSTFVSNVQFVITGNSLFERLRSFIVRSGRIVLNPEGGHADRGADWLHSGRASALILRHAGSDKLMGVYTGVALNAA